MEKPQTVAIIGGGIAGLYTAWRLVKSGKQFTVTIFECAERLGGRIYSQYLPPLPFRAELGAMRFHPLTHHLLRALVDDLDIPTRSFDVAAPDLYVRGRILSAQEILDGQCHHCRAAVPFRLRPDERSKSAEDLIRFILKSLFDDISFPNMTEAQATLIKEKLHEGRYGPDVWDALRLYGMFENIPLREIGFWNLLQHYLSNEAYQLLHHSLSLESVIGNWNAAEAIPWFVSDFTGSDLWMLPGGMSRITEKLTDEIGESPRTNSKVTSVSALQDGKWEVHWKQTGKNSPGTEAKETFDNVIFAVPRSSYSEIDLTAGDFKVPGIDEIESHHLFKIFLLYEHPWWTGGPMPRAATGRTFTDLPLRQVYYFHPDWMKGCATVAKEDWTAPYSAALGEAMKAWNNDESGQRRRWSLVMASYSDEHHVNFWKPVRSRKGKQNDAIHFRPPEGMSIHHSRLLQQELDAAIPDDVRITTRLVRKIQQQLEEIHGHTIEEPIAGIYKDWGAAGESFGGGWHTWMIGADADKFQTAPRPPGLYFCGEVFSRDQGWIEGALRTSECVLRRLGVEPTKRALRYLDHGFDAYVEFREELRTAGPPPAKSEKCP